MIWGRGLNHRFWACPIAENLGFYGFTKRFMVFLWFVYCFLLFFMVCLRFVVVLFENAVSTMVLFVFQWKR